MFRRERRVALFGVQKPEAVSKRYNSSTGWWCSSRPCKTTANIASKKYQYLGSQWFGNEGYLESMINSDGLGLGHNPSNQSAIIGLLFRKTGPACRHFSNKFSLTSEEWSIIRLDTFPLPFFILGIYKNISKWSIDMGWALWSTYSSSQVPGFNNYAYT